MKQIREVLRLYLLADLSSRKIQGATGVARTTVQDYIRRCKESAITFDTLGELDDDALSLKLFGEQKHSTAKPGKVMPDYNYIHQELKQSKKEKTKVTLMFLWEAYKELYGDNAYEYTQFRVYYRRYKQISMILDKYNNKVMKHIGKSRTGLFEELDKSVLRKLPANQYIYEQFKIARVNMNYHIILEKCEYSVPFKYLGEQVELRYSAQHVGIYFKNERIATHPRLRIPGEASTLHEHMPSNHQSIHEKMNPQRLRSWAKSIGEYSTVFIEDAFDAVEHKANAYRRIVAVLSLAKRYGNTELELALMYAAQHRILKVKSIVSVLDKKLYLQKSTNNTDNKTPPLFNTHKNLRGCDTYK